MNRKILISGMGILLISLALISGCLQQEGSSTTTTTITTVSTTLISTTTTKLRIAEISLGGMFCPACAPGAESAFEGVNGVINAKVNFATKKGTVIYDSGIISKEELLQNSLIQAYEGKILWDKEYKGERKW